MSLVPNTVYKFKIESRNLFGYSLAQSNEVSVRAASTPDAPLNLANNVAVTAAGVVGLTWSAGAFNGGSPILDYRVSKFGPGDSSYVVIASGVSVTSYTASSLIADAIYSFKIEARNVIGYSTFSQETSLRSAAKPSTPVAPASSVISNTGVTIVWSAPFNGGSAITSYTIMIRQADGLTYSTELASCNGGNPSVVSAVSCTIPIPVL